MGGSIPKERNIKICCYDFPLFEEKCYLQDITKSILKTLSFTNTYFDGVKCRPPK